MGHLNTVKQNYIFKLRRISHYGALSHDYISSDKRARAHLYICPDDSRALYCGNRRYLDRLMNPNISADAVILVFWKGCGKSCYNFSDMRQYFPWIGVS